MQFDEAMRCDWLGRWTELTPGSWLLAAGRCLCRCVTAAPGYVPAGPRGEAVLRSEMRLPSSTDCVLIPNPLKEDPTIRSL